MLPLPPGTTVLQVLPRLEAGGVERGTIEVAGAVAAAGGIPLVASEGGRMLPALERAGARHIALKLAAKNPWTIWRNAARLQRVLRAEKVSILHARSRAPAWSALGAARREGVPFVTTYHGTYRENVPGKRRYNAVMASGDRVIAISHHVAQHLHERHGVDPARIRIIPRGVDPAVFDPARVAPDRLLRLLTAWRLPEGAPVVVLPARLTRWKGQSVLIEAMARLQNHHAVLVLLGDGRPAFARELAEQAERLGLARRVRLVGHTDDMQAALTLATVAVSASTEPEGFGRAVIEAQAMARPVIATAHGGAAETVHEGLTGFLVPPGDPIALAERLDHVLDMTDEARAALGAASRAHVMAHYTVAAMQDATLGVYRELL